MTRFGLLSTFPPTRCGIATFTASLAAAIEEGQEGDTLVVRLLDADEAGTAASAQPVGVATTLVAADSDSRRRAVATLDRCEVVILQHEYGIYGGTDGAEAVAVLEALTVPAIVVLHTVLRTPTLGQRRVLEQVCALASVVVVMTETAHQLLRGYRVAMEKVRVIPHGVATKPIAHSHHGGRPRVLTWGLIGPGKGIEWGIRAIARLADPEPRPVYSVLGQTHPKVLARHGERYLYSLHALIAELDLEASVTLEPAYLEAPALAAAVAAADIVLLPYDSREQVTSGVLVEAIAARIPVVATAFPHALELLEQGPGIVRGARGSSGDGRRRPCHPHAAGRRRPDATGSRSSHRRMELVRGRGPVRTDRLGPPKGRGGMISSSSGVSRRAGRPPLPQYGHLERLTDARGLFEHAAHAEPRFEHGYCTDDVARGLLAPVVASHPRRIPPGLMATYLGFLEQAIGPDGLAHNRMSVSGVWTDEPGIGDWWGRAVWALGVAAIAAPVPSVRMRATRAFERAAQQSPRDLHAAAFATLGAASLLLARGEHRAAERIVRVFVAMMPLEADEDWPWPEARLRYGNGSIAEATIVAGMVLGDEQLRRRGLRLLRFLLDVEVDDGRLSVTAVGGRGPGERGPQFDQQPIEVAAIADACVRAFEATNDPAWLDGVRMAWSWFEGDNDAGVPMIDLATGAGFDGLEAAGRNQNRGAESTLAALSTWQHVVALSEPRVAA